MRPGVPVSGDVDIVLKSGGDHSDVVGVYLAFIPPGGALNPGGCAPAGVSVIGNVTLPPRGTVTMAYSPTWRCVSSAAVDGLSWTVIAIADAHSDDFSACATVEQVLRQVCGSALADDDQDASNNTRLRVRPKIMAAP